VARKTLSRPGAGPVGNKRRGQAADRTTLADSSIVAVLCNGRATVSPTPGSAVPEVKLVLPPVALSGPCHTIALTTAFGSPRLALSFEGIGGGARGSLALEVLLDRQ
jgi:hypothetical protein